ncbi:glycosyltransferase [Francisella philomiragia]|uniref:Glycosyl transferase 2 family protein n=1 Tax=Francisella philomiragia TaxID=28110 RepID=A0AAW3DCC8_9GAMM|nr:glycosyltransferase family 2 protein [Francisella philomiragia]KFJ42827.1 glycosyl transferase 2 family protein [Francisella philomiragia]MBK2255589.1 glycosyltransferase [Francisella philomiragia]MBK2273919.1 glycosyltransferase [Francisella philomiragia]MBK2277744.1 glycosyltransferase [Francisella philomiragia]MBK2281662.1 glycosyltransferase [Francisella philomiragia]
MSKRITVVTISYNAADFIEKTLISVAEQTAKSQIQYIVIDGGSTDGTLETINKYKEHIDILVSEPDKGIYDAMNKSIDLLCGDWVNFMNAGDTFFSKDTVQRVIESLADDIDIFYGGYYITEETSGKIIQLGDTVAIDMLSRKMKDRMPFCHQSVFVKRELLVKYRFDESFALAADYDFFMKCLYHKHTFGQFDFEVSCYAMGGRSESLELRAAIETVKAYTSYYDMKTVKNSSIYKRLIKLRNIKQDRLIMALEVDLNNKNAEIKSFYGDLPYRLARVLTYPINKYRLIRGKK